MPLLRLQPGDTIANRGKLQYHAHMNESQISQPANDAFGRRVGAALIDVIIWVILFFVFSAAFGTITATQQPNGATYQQANLTGLPFLVYVCLWILYFVVLEWRFGATLGKLAAGVRVRSADGKPITLQQSVVRNLLRIVDAFPFFIPYLAGLVIATIDKNRQRVGDKAAKTVVVGQAKA